MSQSGAVYQPTTVTYEANSPQDRWSDRPISYLAATVTQAARRPCGLPCLPTRDYIPAVLLFLCSFFFAFGLVMFIQGVVGYSAEDSKDDDSCIINLVVGAVLFLISIPLFVMFLRASRRLCWRNAKDHLDTAGGQALTVNPSTDLLVAAQYAPVSEVAYQPPQEDTEQSKLMPQENKDLSNEDTDRMVESDPRIVLRPLNPPTHEET